MNATDLAAPVFLDSDTKIEPLVFRWYAWGHLVSPVQQALNLAFRQLPALKSFIANPGVHEAASRNPKMLGGAFLELTQRDVASVRALLQDILERGANLLGFAQDLLDLDRRLQKHESGFSLDHLYADLPASLAGLVEAGYDLNNHPSLRIVEDLVYLDGPAHADAQEIAFSRTRDEARNFFINTPRLDTEQRFVIPAPFADTRFDLLSESRIAPVPFETIAEALGVADPAARTRLRSYFSATPPRRDAPEYTEDAVRVRYFGHACVLVQSADVSVLIDPFVTWDHDDANARLTFHDLPDHIDYVFLTHNHQDHFSVEALLQLRNRIGAVLVPRNNVNNLADPSMKLALRAIGHHRVRVMDPLERIELPGGWLTSLPFYGEHADLSIASKHGMCLDLKGRRMLFLADSDCKDRILYRRIARHVGQIDRLFIGMECDGAPLTWLYGPYLSTPINRKDDDSRRLSGSDCEHAWSIVEEFGCRHAYVYAMGQEPWLRFVAGLEYTPESKQIVESDRFVARCRDAGLEAERLHGCQTFVF
ncbi:MBL fold metallo-hydrolase (plasmid) [Burkholderia sp. FERM BP-3421]|jgi:L-ascorbate metabolism protein UlaG (beta-lactamase superfamily)|uniref:MBL fold metallo-hydrolase n=1 Tax=Burkholderia sp. FERM BP-3421 TaxID=1494466 RepID=UPI0023605E5F|nr:MBL fold metallo-hydrolase [Burkholderia sp. FERM BP-3421]WDD90606.1 MBL fold metallo-hydrolase [Burkholderia sp. FERM BP-3421]